MYNNSSPQRNLMRNTLINTKSKNIAIKSTFVPYTLIMSHRYTNNYKGNIIMYTPCKPFDNSSSYSFLSSPKAVSFILFILFSQLLKY